MWRKELFHFAMVCSQFAPSRVNEARKEWMADRDEDGDGEGAMACTRLLFSSGLIFCPFLPVPYRVLYPTTTKETKTTYRIREKACWDDSCWHCFHLSADAKVIEGRERWKERVLLQHTIPSLGVTCRLPEKRVSQAEPSAVCNWFASLAWHQLRLMLSL